MENIDSARDEIIEQHRHEKKELQTKIARMRQSVPKTDKKKKKEIAIEIEELEEDLKVRHEQEIEEFDRKNRPIKTKTSNDEETFDMNNKGYKPSKSARRRENKERKAKEQQERIAAGTIDDSENLRIIELKKIEELLLQRDCYLVDVPSDGDCMYKALEHQLKITRCRDIPVKDLRKNASEFILQNKDEFWPFLTNDNGDMFNDREFDDYCNKVANTKTWGGQLELRAISNVLQVPIEVIQSEGAPVEIGFHEYGSKNPLVLCYFRHAYQLGEHYNSVQPIKVSKDKDEEWHS